MQSLDDPASFITKFHDRRRSLGKFPINDAEMLEALRHMRTQMIATELTNTFKHKGINFITRCIHYLKNGQYKQVNEVAAPKAWFVPKSKLELYPDKSE